MDLPKSTKEKTLDAAFMPIMIMSMAQIAGMSLYLTVITLTIFTMAIAMPSMRITGTITDLRSELTN